MHTRSGICKCGSPSRPGQGYCNKCSAAQTRKWRKGRTLSPEDRRRDRCRSYTAVLIKRGHLQRQPCEVCGAQAQAHHEDYDDPRTVRWFCPPHHREHHKKVSLDRNPDIAHTPIMSVSELSVSSSGRPDVTGWPTVEETARELQTTERTIRRWIAQHKLAARLKRVPGRRAAVLIDPRDIERIRAGQSPAPVLLEPIRNEPVIQREMAVAHLASQVPDIIAGLAGAVSSLRRPEARPFLSLRDAAEYSGLPRRLLVRLVREGRLKARRHSGDWWVRRSDLDSTELGGTSGETIP